MSRKGRRTCVYRWSREVSCWSLHYRLGILRVVIDSWSSVYRFSHVKLSPVVTAACVNADRRPYLFVSAKLASFFQFPLRQRRRQRVSISSGTYTYCARHGQARESSKVVRRLYDLSYRAGGSGRISRRRRAVTAENWIVRSTRPTFSSRGCRARSCEEPLDADRVARRDGAEVSHVSVARSAVEGLCFGVNKTTDVQVVEPVETAASDSAEPLEEE